VDFQAMLDMRTCPECNGDRLKKESLNVFISTKTNKKSDSFVKHNIADLQKMPLHELIDILKNYREKTKKDATLVQRITHPLIDRCQTISELGLGYLMLNR
jgi:excinuclease ABC subunit A